MPKSQNRRRYWGYYLQLWCYLWWNGEIAMASSKEINVNVGAVLTINPADIKTAGQYIITDHLGRGLVSENAQGYLEGDILNSWKISQDKKTYDFILKENIFWSDGSKVTSTDIVEYLNWHLKLNTSNHTNLNLIKEIRKISEKELVISLKESHQSFLNYLNNADMGLFKIKNNQIDFNLSSGAYVLEAINNKSVILTKNKYYPNHHSNSPDKIIFHNDIQNIQNIKNLNFIWPLNLSDKDFLEAEKTLNFKRASPNYLYTHWLSLNPQSPHLKNQEDRLFLSYLIREYSMRYYSSNESLSTNADQLLWEDGVGDLSKDEVERFWKSIKEKYKNSDKKFNLRILAANYPNIRFVIDELNKQGHKLTIDWINNYYERLEFLKKHKYDVTYHSNDFSDIDPYASFRVALNPHKPYITTDEQDAQFDNLLTSILSLPSEERIRYYEDISRKILSKGYIGLLSKNQQHFLYKGIDLSTWNKSTPEMKFWKTPVTENVQANAN